MEKSLEIIPYSIRPIFLNSPRAREEAKTSIMSKIGAKGFPFRTAKTKKLNSIKFFIVFLRTKSKMLLLFNAINQYMMLN